MKQAFLAFVVLMFFAGGFSLAESNRNADNYNTGQPQTVNSKTSLKEAAVTGEYAGSGSEHKKEKCDYDGPIWFTGFYCFFADHEKFWVSFGTLVLAAFTTILGFATIILARATNSLVKGSERTAERQLRAYVHVTHSQLTLANIGYEPNIVVQIKNFGQTPARNIKGKLLFKPLVEPTKDSDFSSPEFRLGESPDLGPGQSNPFRTFIDKTNWTFMKPNLAAKKTTLYVFGCITYNDAFTDELRTTEFRYRMLVDDDGITDAMTLDPVGHAGNRTT